MKMSFKRLEPWQDPKQKPFIHISGVSKNYGPVQAVDNMSLSIYQGEFFSLLGGSGCGKTTLLRMLAGFEMPSHGRIYLDGIDITDTQPHQRPVNMMFQSYALFPHMTVKDNVAFGLRQEKLPVSQISERVKSILNLVHMFDFMDRYPAQLSGGQCQRVALARALIKQPKCLLLDEPLGALDRKLREKTQIELVNLQEQLNITFVMVTHDQEEAMTMSTRLCIMEQGRVGQVGTPSEIYEYPNTLSVARFIGSINTFEGIIVESTKRMTKVQVEGLEAELRVQTTSIAPVGANVWVAIRPEKIIISHHPFEDHGTNAAEGIVQEIIYLGDVSIYYVQLPSGQMVQATQPNLVRLAERSVTWGDTVYLHWKSENSIILTT